MDNRQIIKKVLDDTLLMTNDVKSFLFLRSEGLPYLKKYNLGGGNLLSLLGLFSILGMLSKIFFILKCGVDLSKKKIDHEELVAFLKKNKKYNKYRNHIKSLSDICNINEVNAFVELITSYPNDIGLNDKTRDELCEI